MSRKRPSGVPVEHEPNDFPIAHIQEACCFCRKPTRYWTALADRKPGQQVACCQSCAAAHKPSEVPTKDAWWDYKPQDKPAPSPLARVREALEASANNGTSRPQRLAKDALPALTALERALPVLMESHHALKRIQFKGGHGAIRWQDCTDCAALLEGK